MAIQVFNTLSRRKEPLAPLREGAVSMYVCGPTVYSDCHIGHLMGPVLFDTVARWLRARGYAVRFVNNITDIDDKIIDRARSTGEDWRTIAERYTAQYIELLAALGVETITDRPHATDYIDAMVAFVARLEARGLAYPAGDGVYFDLARHTGYGQLSGRSIEDMRAGARIERRSDLRNPGDFCLWKFAKPDEPSWPSPWGDGRPGWHIECSVMTEQLLGGDFDIHGGGDDLKFPHHENEVAQSTANGYGFARVWMHNGMVQYEGAKVAKSDPRNADPAFARQFQARWLIDTYSAPVIRFLFLQGHYRRPVDFAPQHVHAAAKALDRLQRQLGALLEEETAIGLDAILARDLPPELAAARDAFCAAMDDDFNTGAALGQLFALAAIARKTDDPLRAQALHLIRDLGRLLGLFAPDDRIATSPTTDADDTLLAALTDLLLELRQQARGNKDFATADRIRDRLGELGITVTDGKEGARWQRA